MKKEYESAELHIVLIEADVITNSDQFGTDPLTIEDEFAED